MFSSFYAYLKTKSSTIDEKTSFNLIKLFCSINFDGIKNNGILISIAWLGLNISPSSNESMQILLDIISSSKNLPTILINDTFDFILNQINNEKILEQFLNILSIDSNYEIILTNKTNEIIEQMKINDDLVNLRSLEKYLLLFSYIRSDNLSFIIDRLINSSSYSSISYSILDTRYILAMIILNSLINFDKYILFLHQIWKLLIKETNDIKQVVIVYAKQWKNIFQNNLTNDDINTFVKYLYDQYDLLSNILQIIDQNQFQQWINERIQSIVCFHLLLLFFYMKILFFLYRKFH